MYLVNFPFGLFDQLFRPDLYGAIANLLRLVYVLLGIPVLTSTVQVPDGSQVTCIHVYSGSKAL